MDDHLASCGTVHIYVHQINSKWEIIMDDVQISAPGTESPTEPPTLAPTEVELVLTDIPTAKPTSMPTMATSIECPADVSSPYEIAAGPAMLVRSSSLCILTKAVVDVNGIMSSIAPVARSYDGHPWEKSAGDFATTLLYGQEFGEYTAGSQITLPPLDGDEKYYLTSYSYSLSDENAVARLLETATFGTTSDDLRAWDRGAVTNETAAQWIAEQMNKPITSHREFFRRRVNPRVSFIFAV